MYFSTNVIFRTLHSNSTIYLFLPLCDDVKVHSPALVCMIGVGRAAVEKCACVNSKSCVRKLFIISKQYSCIFAPGLHMNLLKILMNTLKKILLFGLLQRTVHLFEDLVMKCFLLYLMALYFSLGIYLPSHLNRL